MRPSDLPPQYERTAVVSPRPDEMKVLVLGMSRTGTTSIYTALREMGYRCYHMTEAVLQNSNGHPRLWLEALRAKYYGKGKPYQGADFDKMLWSYDAVSDIPCIQFADELLATYPNAKVVLTYRDEERWLASMEHSFYTIMTNTTAWDILALFDREVMYYYWPLLLTSMKVWTHDDWRNRTKLVQAFRAHNEHVRAVVPRDRLLEFKAQDGWAPLCKFLGKPVPEEPYPHVNGGESVAKVHVWFFWYRVTVVSTRVSGALAVLGLVAWAARWWRG